MENSLISVLKYVISFIESLVAETVIILLLLGLLFLLIGLFTIAAWINNIIFSTKVKGRVIGAVKATHTKEKLIDGKLEKESKERLHPIYEYSKEDGALHQVRGSSSGSYVLKYKTGQDVNLVIHNDSATDAGDRTLVYVSLFFAGFGSILIYMAGDVLKSLTISLAVIVVIAIALFLKVKGKGKGRMKFTPVKKESDFDLKNMRPIEDFIEASAKI